MSWGVGTAAGDPPDDASGSPARRGPLVLAGVLAVVLGIAALSWRVPYVLLQPGPTFNTLGSLGTGGQPLISVSGHRAYQPTGHLDLTTVNVVGCQGERVTLLDALRGWFARSSAVVPRAVICPPDQTASQVQQQNQHDMQDSQDHARVAALRYLHVPVRTAVTVDALVAGYPAQRAGLAVGDVIRAVDGSPVTGADQLRALVGRHPAGTTLTLSLTRGGKPRTVRVTTVPASAKDRRPIVGITPGTQADLPFTVTIQLNDVGGPSAGLMLALGIVAKLSPEDLTHGAFIAGTGTIGDDGTVGPIGGVQQKIAAARQRGATVFLTPSANCADAAAARPPGLRLVRVTALRDAVDSLERLARGQGVPECTLS